MEQGQTPQPVVIVLAAGRGERFRASGGALHKLDAPLAGKPVLEHVLDAVRASGLPMHVVRPDPSRPGMGESIAAGVRATADAPGWLVLPGDLPLVRPETLRAVATALLQGAAQAVVPWWDGHRGHPVGFAHACRDALQDLKGNQGAAPVLSGLSATNCVANITSNDPGCITDIDTLDDLARAEALASRRTQGT